MTGPRNFFVFWFTNALRVSLKVAGHSPMGGRGNVLCTKKKEVDVL